VRLAACGVSGIWNFTNEKLSVPPEVVVQNEDLSSGLAVLCARLRQNQEGRPAGPEGRKG